MLAEKAKFLASKQNASGLKYYLLRKSLVVKLLVTGPLWSDVQIQIIQVADLFDCYMFRHIWYLNISYCAISVKKTSLKSFKIIKYFILCQISAKGK